LWTLDLGAATPASGTLAPLTDGNIYSVTATVTDAAGNATPDVTSSELKIDTTAPLVPTVNALITNDTTPIITGTSGTGAALIAGEVLSVVVNGATYAVTPDASGLWTLDLGAATPASGTLAPLTDGNIYSVTATVTDAAGNATPDVTTSELKIDAATAVAITAISQDSGTAGDFITNDPTLIFSGTAEIGSSVVVKLLDTNNQVVFAQTVSAPAGTWSIDHSAFNLPAGSYQLFTEATDTVGNKANALQVVTIENAIVASNVDIATATDTGANDLVTANGNPQISLQAAPGLTLALKGVDGSTLLPAQYSVTETLLANGQSSYVVTLLDADLSKPGAQPFGDFAAGVAANNPANATDGIYQIVATSPSSGVSGVAGGFTIDTSAPAALTLDLPASEDTGSSAVDNITSNSVVLLSGTAEPNSSVNLYKPDGSLYATVTTNSLGDWQVAGVDLTKIDGDDKDGVLNEDGTFTFTAKTVDAAGNESPAATLTLTLDRTLPSIDLPTQFDSGESNSDNLTNMPVIALQGNAPAGSQVQIKAPDGTTIIGTVTADAQGHWTLPNVTLTAINNNVGVKADGAYTFYAEVLDSSGQATNGLGSQITVLLDTKAPDKPLTINLTDESDLKTDGTLNDITNLPTAKFYVTLPTAAVADIKAGDILKLYAAPVAGGTPQLVSTHVLTAADINAHATFMVTDSLSDNVYNFGVKLFDYAGNALDTATTVAEIRTDLDGVAPNIEDAGSTGGDFNGDGKPDYLQNGVATFPVLPSAGQSGSQAFAAGILAPKPAFGSLLAADLKVPTTALQNIVVDPNAQLQNVAVLAFTDPQFAGQAKPSNVTAVTDPLQFSVTNIQGSSQTLVDLDPTRDGLQTRLVLEIPEGVMADTFIKFGPTKDNATPHFFEFLADGNLNTYDDGAELFRNSAGKVDRVVITLTDNGVGDTNPAVGVITDPGYLALRNVVTPTPAPTYNPTPTPVTVSEPIRKPIPVTGSDNNGNSPTTGNAAHVACANDTLIDGMTVESMQINSLVVPIVTAARFDNTTSSNHLLADIPVVTNSNGEIVLQVSIPEHVGFTAEQIISPCLDFTLREMLMTAAESQIEPLSALNVILQQGIDQYLPTVADEKQVVVRTIIFNQDNTVV
ncbi:MAG: hypothetical protein HOP02_16935, partial [Methylococcaceae bacterium]|nr:hypothetical protein [Methylococcaceae bacterium]